MREKNALLKAKIDKKWTTDTYRIEQKVITNKELAEVTELQENKSYGTTKNSKGMIS